MSVDAAGRVHLSVAEARALAERAMGGIGYGREEARILADHVIDAALCGYEYSGLPKLLNVAEYPRFKLPRGPMRVVQETSVSARFDGGNQSGMLGMYYATRAVIERALAQGLALVAVSNIWMSGRSAYYVEMVARAGLIGIHTVAAPPMVAPFGGTRVALGTNPIAFGFPMEGDPLVIDLGTSAFMGTDLQFRQRLGIPLPDGVAIDEHGRPTTDAGAARRGAILPFGGHKGYALALAMHALGVLGGGAGGQEDSGYLFIAFKPDLLMPREDYRRALVPSSRRSRRPPPTGWRHRDPHSRGARVSRARPPHPGGHRDRPANPRRSGPPRAGAAKPPGRRRRSCERTR
jgi:LDH2 family malate/lactate/ureidoglycolate dehydrogenase